MSGITKLIDYAQDSLIDLDLSCCDMNFKNFVCLSNKIKGICIEDAEKFNNGELRGTLRKINLSYNPFLRKSQRYLGPNL